MAFKPGDEWPPGARRRPFIHRVARPSVDASDAEALKPRTSVRGVGSFEKFQLPKFLFRLPLLYYVVLHDCPIPSCSNRPDVISI